MTTDLATGALPCNGSAISLRDLRSDDGPILQEIFAGLSPESRFLRFHTAVVKLRGAAERALLAVDGVDHVAVVAKVSGRAVGIVRIIRDPCRPDTAEVAIAVVDDYQRQGIGRQLLAAVSARALRLGMVHLIAPTLSCNAAAISLFESAFPHRLITRGTGVVELHAVIDPSAGWDITVDDLVGRSRW